jgi:ABC-type multidrug transport system ATPase subunit
MFLGLLRPFKVLFLDEVTAVLDLVCRQDLLAYLKQECEERGCTIVYATHIFDGLDEWATHCVYLRAQPEHGKIGYFGPMKEIPKFQELLAAGSPSPLMGTIEFWLRAELKIARDKGLMEGESGAGVHPENFSIRLAGQMALESMDEEKKKAWLAKKEARDTAMAAIEAVVEDGGRSVDEKVARLREMEKAGEFNDIAGSHQSHLVLTEAIEKLPGRKKATSMVNGGFGSGRMQQGYQ